MKNPRISIFIRILLATLLPLLVIFGIILFTINRVVYNTNIDFARERTVLVAQQAASRVESVFTAVSSLLSATANDVTAVRKNEGRLDVRNIRDFIRALLLANDGIYCAWVIMEDGFIPGSGREGLSIIQPDDGGAPEMRDVPSAILEKTAGVHWYRMPLDTGRPFVFTTGLYDFREGKGPQLTAALSYPVIVDGESIGVVGVDMLYDQALTFLREWEVANQQRILLLADDETILYSTAPEVMGKKVKDVNFDDATFKAFSDALLQRQGTLFEGVSPFTLQRTLYSLSPLTLPHVDRTLFLLSGIPVTAVYRTAERTFALVSSVSILGMILLAASVYLATRNIVKPIRKLTRAAEWIANGNLDVVLDDFGEHRHPRHEVDQLEMSLKKMLEELNQTHELRLTAMEVELEKNRLEQSSEAKERFFANMSHEIRTPMNAILGMSELLLREGLNERQDKFVRDIKTSSESLLGIINDILDLSKLESGKFPLYNVHYDLRALLDNIGSVCRFLAGNKGLAFRLDTAISVPRFVFGDDLRLKQVLLNVIGNAIKFTDEGQVTVTVTNDEKELRFAVADTGRGIREEDMPSLFLPFKRFEEERDTAVKGTGLGLSITSHLLGLMGGGVDVESVFGKGSVFRLHVPLVPGDPMKMEAKEQLRSVVFDASARVLVVDDNQINLDVAVGMIGLHGVNCERASSGAEAIEMVRQYDYDIIFMDHMMPGMDGVETMRRIRAMGGGHEKQPIVALTANAVIGTREKLIQEGMNDFLPKPIVNTELAAMLAKWIPVHKQKPLGATTPEKKVPVAITGGDSDEDTVVLAGCSVADQGTIGRLRRVEGLEVDKGLFRVSGHVDLFLSTLAAVEGMRQSAVPSLRSSLAEENLKGFAIEIHGIKSALASIGAETLAASALELETAAKEGQAAVCRGLLPPFLTVFSQFADAVRDALTPVEPEKGPEPETRPEHDTSLLFSELTDTVWTGSGGEETKVLNPAAGAPGPEAEQTRREPNPDDADTEVLEDLRDPGGREELFVGLTELRTALMHSNSRESEELLAALGVFNFGPVVNDHLALVSRMVEAADFPGAVAEVESLMRNGGR